ncbi:hypothetical protein BV210_02495 [Halorientalis sp. IM1011]|uniref:hypothetical protein n=1 Tax=Halorientalis sp. IM1011 TaxID=1932360 RepID=UPI00097CC821|nr:hypothetical protein [Halorientalis sp. IM1011]AQL41651.1 hypothetical protein BV210_02495 [Halorientalis sp. IM1011]
MPAEPTTGTGAAPELVDVVELFTSNNAVRWSSAPAVRAANLHDHKSLLFAPHPDRQALVAVATTEAIDGRSQENAVRIRSDRGNHALPKELLEHLGADFDAVDTGSLRVAIFATDGLLVFQPATTVAECPVPADLIEATRAGQ